VSSSGVRITNVAILGLPLLTVVVICFALLVVAAPRPYPGARLYGGPTDAQHLSFRVEAVERLRELEEPIAHRSVRLDAVFPDGQKRTWTGQLDGLGMAHVAFPVPARHANPLHVTVAFADGPARVLAIGRVALASRDWLRDVKTQGGWLRGLQTGQLRVDVAAGRGVFAVPFADPLLVRVRDERGQAVRADLHLEGEGISIEQPRGLALLHSDERGLAQTRIRPLEHAVALRVIAESKAGTRGDWYAVLPILPGALHAEVDAGRLRIESPVVRDVAYFALINEQGRLASGSVRLRADGRGGASGVVPLPPVVSAPCWAIVSSEADLDSPSAIGWSIVAKGTDLEPLFTRTVADRLLLDGVVQNWGSDRQRKLWARLLAGGFALLAAALLVALVILRVRAADVDIEERLHDLVQEPTSSAALRARHSRWALLVAVLCILMGFAGVALLAMHRIH
jgi:hypothetical protein